MMLLEDAVTYMAMRALANTVAAEEQSMMQRKGDMRENISLRATLV